MIFFQTSKAITYKKRQSHVRPKIRENLQYGIRTLSKDGRRYLPLMSKYMYVINGNGKKFYLFIYLYNASRRQRIKLQSGPPTEQLSV